MRIKVEYTAHLKRAVGTGLEELEVEDSSGISELIETLLALHGKKLRNQILNAQGDLHPSVIVAVNGEQVYLESGRQLREGDAVVLLAAIAGG